jgi:hypothetical protein
MSRFYTPTAGEIFNLALISYWQVLNGDVQLPLYRHKAEILKSQL